MKNYELKPRYPGKPNGVQDVVSADGHVWATIIPTTNTKGRRRYAVVLTDIDWVGEYRDFDEALGQVAKLLDSVPESEGQAQKSVESVKPASRTYTTYSAHVNGTLWEGSEGSTTYTFDFQPSALDVKNRAGDFQDCTVEKVVRRDAVFTDSELAKGE